MKYPRVKRLAPVLALVAALMAFLPLFAAAEDCPHLNVTDTDETYSTCYSPGYTAGVYCNDCETYISGHVKKPLKEHALDEGAVQVKPTCQSPGVMLYRCTVKSCGATVEKPIPQDPDAHVLQVTVVEPTCVDDGYTMHACTLCRYGYADEPTRALGHTYGIRITPPTCMAGGITTYTCTRCRDSYTANPTPALDHVDADGDGYCDFGCGTAVCRYCHGVHTGPMGGLIAFFHRVAFLFQKLFGKTAA